ncbi:hypothetical protein BaRGS_00036608 [Batillaria attramentaria]|uniref:Cysteine sulfinic acid decarboxylase n=1 Tax=Batillaria attramentaria TaxID=370345 RepID=A0ABD0JB70_9CAEN
MISLSVQNVQVLWLVTFSKYECTVCLLLYKCWRRIRSVIRLTGLANPALTSRDLLISTSPITSLLQTVVNRRDMATSRSSPYKDPEIVKFLDDFHKLIVEEALQGGTDRDTKVTNFQQPHDLEKLLKLEVSAEGETPEEILQHGRRIIQYSVKTGHPRFFNQLYSGIEPFSLAGSWLSDALNTNLHTYEVAPAFVVIEKYMMRKICDVIGFSEGEGIFCPGGSFSNLMATHLARYRINPELRQKGLFGAPKMMLYTSQEAHYSLKKAAFFMGFGTDHVVGIPTDEKGRLRPDAFEEQVQRDKAKGLIPTIVMATSGTTVLGAYDELPKLADVCAKHGVWLHVDAAWGGGVLLTEKYRDRMAGIERADSVAWNLHKMSNVPIQCSALLVKQQGMLMDANGLKAEYLFMPDKAYDVSYDIGDRTVQCGRKVDAVKVWMMWKALGDKGMGERVERAFENAEYFTKRIKDREGFRFVIPEFECTNICFWYIPPSLRGQEETEEWWAKLGKVAPRIKQRMMEQGTMLVGYTPLAPKNFVNFFRIIIHNPLCDFSDMDFVIDEIERLGKDL